MTSSLLGLKRFLINTMVKDVPMKEICKCVLAFCAIDLVRGLLVLFIPAICLWLPRLK